MENFNLSSFKTYKSVIEDIKEYSQEAVLNFLQIGRLFKRVKEEKLYEIEDYSSVYEFALNKFGYRETSVKNFIAVFDKYADTTDVRNSYFDIKEEYENYSFTSLVELLPVPEKEIKENYSSEMTVKEIRQTKLVSQLTDDLQEKIKRYTDLVDLLKHEMNCFNERIGKSVLKYLVEADNYSLDKFKLRSFFKYNWRSYYIDFDCDYQLRVDYSSIETKSNEEIVNDFKNNFLVKVENEYLTDKKNEEEKKIKKCIEKESLYREIMLYSAKYENEFFYTICMYLYYVILNSDKSKYNIKVLSYKDKSIYELEIEYQDLMIGYFGYNDETKETYFKFKIPKNEQSNNQIFKDYDLFYWTIDTDWKRCEIFNSETLKRIKQYYEELKGEKNDN